MPYDPTDIRSQLATAPRAAGANVAPHYAEFGSTEPTELTPGGGRLWWIRSQACVVNYAELAAGDTLARAGQPDEYLVLVPSGEARLTLTATPNDTGSPVTAVGRSLVVMPPGDTALTATTATVVVRLFSSQATDLTVRCANDAFYAEPDPNVSPYAAWPDPPGGHRIRVYPLDDYPKDPGRFGRLFRCSTLMVNYFYPDPGPRDPAKLSPHHHDDFEQLSLQLAGDYVHHIRTPWVPDLAQWRPDEHQHCTSPSVTVIPPPSVHTSQGVGDSEHQLIDIFAPPRFDFSAQAGWVLNADEYPIPDV
jgi:hypothetical protein